MATLRLRPFSLELARDVINGHRHDDWAEGYPTAGDHEVAGRIADGAWTPPSAVQPWGAWAVLDGEVVVGGAGFHGPLDENGVAEIGYGIAPEWQGCGIATAAVRALVELASAHGARQLVAATDRDNVASQRVLEHCGFTLESTTDDELHWSLDLLPQSPA